MKNKILKIKDKQIKERLLFLYKKSKEDKEILIMQKNSLISFLFFINSGLKLKKFIIKLDYRGHINILWKDSENKLIDIDFIDKDNNHFLSYFPNEGKYKFKHSRFCKNFVISELIKHISNNNCCKWILKNDKILLSNCCNAPVKLGNPRPDFIGEKEPYKMGTQYYVCSKCGKPCDIINKKK